VPSGPESPSAHALLDSDEDMAPVAALREGDEDAFVILTERYHAPSGGRLRIGFGQGWSNDEYDAVGVSPRGLGRRGDEEDIQSGLPSCQHNS
jgi:hypothetical protein